MTFRNTLLATLALMPLTAAAPASHAIAQDAIMLETVGAVRMASPAEIRAMSDEATRQKQQHTAQPAPLPQRQAVVTD